MKYIKQLLIILCISFMGEVLKYLIPLPVPASIYGLLLLLTALLTGVLKLEKIKDVSVFLIEIMPLMFIPAAVGLMDSWSALGGILVQVIITVVVSTIVVMGVSGVVTQMIIRREEQKTNERTVL
ncbi:MAG: CidA/LrgA family protein [Lachnospiraceae bacterium]|nr:CidA/LrgA family protein [Lachnospiraceae bacterium]